MSNTRHIVISTALAIGLLAGCSSQDVLADAEGQTDEDEITEERYGALSAQFVYPRLWDEQGVEVQAQFLDARGVAVESALEALEVWMPRRGLEMESCVMSDGAVSTPRHDPISLHLLDVGQIEVISPQEHRVLQPRRLPDLLSAFYGVVYGSEWAEPSSGEFVEYFPGAQYRFAAPGSEEAGNFDFTVEAPDPIVLLAANGEVIRDETSITVSANEALELVWASDGFGWSPDEVYIDLSAGFGPDQTRIQCRVADEGAFSIPSSKLRELSRFSDNVDLSVRRVRSGQTDVDGLDQVDFYFATVDEIELRLK